MVEREVHSAETGVDQGGGMKNRYSKETPKLAYIGSATTPAGSALNCRGGGSMRFLSETTFTIREASTTTQQATYCFPQNTLRVKQ